MHDPSAEHSDRPAPPDANDVAAAGNLVATVTELGAAELARRIAAGELTSREVVDAHIAQIESVDDRLGAVVIRLFDRARDEAMRADEARKTGTMLGPLHGVPVTIKECFYVAGTDATLGVDRLVGRPTPEDGPLVRRLRAVGAIVLGKTNLPQLMLLHESDNPIYGRTNNPWRLDRGPGGSSGGEAAIVAARGSPLGLGSDMGGSIRQPAHACGVYGFKPTSGRLSNIGSRLFAQGMREIAVQPGPIARSTADLKLAMQILAPSDADRQDDEQPAAWRDPDQVDVAGLRIGMWEDDGFVRPSPAIRRAVREAAEALRRGGATVEPLDPPDVHEMLRLYVGIVSADGGANIVQFLGDSRRDRRIQQQLRFGRLPRPLRKALATMLSLAGQKKSAHMLRGVGACSAATYWELTEAKEALRTRLLSDLAARGVAAILCPPHALPALRHGDGVYLLPAATACFLANLLGLPAGVVPATNIRADEESDRPASRDIVDRLAAKCEAGSVGLPVGVQVVGLPWREDIVLAVMQALETGFRPTGRLPAPSLSPSSSSSETRQTSP